MSVTGLSSEPSIEKDYNQSLIPRADQDPGIAFQISSPSFPRDPLLPFLLDDPLMSIAWTLFVSDPDTIDLAR